MRRNLQQASHLNDFTTLIPMWADTYTDLYAYRPGIGDIPGHGLGITCEKNWVWTASGNSQGRTIAQAHVGFVAPRLLVSVDGELQRSLAYG